MSGCFEGVSDAQWQMLSPILTARSGSIGRPRANARKVLNTILYVLITGCRWCDIPKGEQWGKRSTSHDCLGRWLKDGTFFRLGNPCFRQPI